MDGLSSGTTNDRPYCCSNISCPYHVKGYKTEKSLKRHYILSPSCRGEAAFASLGVSSASSALQADTSMLSVQSVTSSSFLALDDSFGDIMDSSEEDFLSPHAMEDLLFGFGDDDHKDRSADDHYPLADNDAFDESMVHNDGRDDASTSTSSHGSAHYFRGNPTFVFEFEQHPSASLPEDPDDDDANASESLPSLSDQPSVSSTESSIPEDESLLGERQEVSNMLSQFEFLSDEMDALMMADEYQDEHEFLVPETVEEGVDDSDDESAVDALDHETFLLKMFDTYCSQQLPEKYEKAAEKLHPLEEDLCVLMRENHLHSDMFRTIMDFAKRAKDSDYDFSKRTTYRTTLNRMAKKYFLQSGPPPIRTTVEMGSQFPPVTVYRYSLLHLITAALQDPDNLEDAMWHYEEKFDENGDRVYDTLNSSEWWRRQEEEMNKTLESLGEKKPKGDHCICPFIGFDDESFGGVLGKLIFQPYLACPGNVSDKRRRNPNSWHVLGMIPPYPKSSKEREADRSSKTTELEYIKYYHTVLRVLLKDLLELASRPGGVPVSIPGRGIVNLHFRLCMVIGDTKGHDSACCHYNCHSSCIKRMVRDCNIPQANGDDPSYDCTFVNEEEIQDVVKKGMAVVNREMPGSVEEARESCKAVSQHLLCSAYWDIPNVLGPFGTFALFPWEMLHVYQIGFMKYLLHALYNYREVPTAMQRWYRQRRGISDDFWDESSDGSAVLHDKGKEVDSQTKERLPLTEAEEGRQSTSFMDETFLQEEGGTFDLEESIVQQGSLLQRPSVAYKKLPKAFDQPEFEKRARVVLSAARRQSDRSMPRMPQNKGCGLTQQTKMNGQEIPGLCLVTLVCMKGMLHDKDEVQEWAFANLLFMTLAMECILQKESYTEGYLALLVKFIQKYLEIFRAVIGPIRECMSKSGLRIPKFHCLLHFAYYIRQFGSTYNFYGGFCESHMKSLIKKETKHTSRRQDRFDLDVMNRQHDNDVCKAAKRTLSEAYWFGPPEEEHYSTKANTAATAAANVDYDNPDDGEFTSQEEEETFDNGGGEGDVFQPSQTKFVAEKINDRWTVRQGSTTYSNLVYPDVAGSYGNVRVKALCDSANALGYNRVEFFYSCSIPSLREQGTGRDILRFNPDYHSTPSARRSWYDWVTIQWETQSGGRTYKQAAKLLLGGKFVDTETGESEMHFVIQSLASNRPKKDSLLSFFVGDRIERCIRVVTSEMIHEVAYVLPTVEKPGDTFPESAESANYFVVIPPRSEWEAIGLDLIDKFDVTKV